MIQIGDFSLATEVADLIEITAVVVIAIGVVAAVVGAIVTGIQSDWDSAFERFRRLMARGLLIGLDLLIAADIIKTVTLEPTLENILGLGLLVVIRTFLSWALILEAEGHWPWQQDSVHGSDV
jgi:uncharacterized membrane protein